MISLTIYPLTFFLYLKVNQRGRERTKRATRGRLISVEERERLGRAGRETLKGWPTWDDLARDIYSVYSELWKALKRGEWPRKPPR